MAEALLRGALNAGLLSPEDVTACDPKPDRQRLFREGLKVRIAENAAAVAESADLLMLCVKPQQCKTVLAELKTAFSVERHLLVSILAGTTIEQLEAGLPKGARVVRVMPNTPMLVGLGASGLSAGHNAVTSDVELVERLLSCASTVVRVREPQLDAVTAVSGSGPAYLFYLVEAMAEAGTAEGLSKEDALRLAVRTCLGAAKMAEDTGTPPEELRRRVTSPNGTTQAAVEVLDSETVKKKLVLAVKRAAERSRELSRS
jgi:pyrroline-5-carboxylate reductase